MRLIECRNSKSYVLENQWVFKQKCHFKREQFIGALGYKIDVL